jgi:hypothetical protein
VSINYTPRTFVVGEAWTAAKANTEIRDLANGIQAAWTAYTPALTNITLGNGSLAGSAYIQIGKTIKFRVLLTLGSTTVISGGMQFSLPVAALTALGSGNYPVGDSSLRDSSASATVYGGCRMLASATGIAPTYNNTATSSTDCTATLPWTWAVGDTVWIEGEYEAA